MTVRQLQSMLAHLPEDVQGLNIELQHPAGGDLPIWEVHVIPYDNKAHWAPRVVLRFNASLDKKALPLVITESRHGM